MLTTSNAAAKVAEMLHEKKRFKCFSFWFLSSKSVIWIVAITEWLLFECGVKNFVRNSHLINLEALDSRLFVWVTRLKFKDGLAIQKPDEIDDIILFGVVILSRMCLFICNEIIGAYFWLMLVHKPDVFEQAWLHSLL